MRNEDVSRLAVILEKAAEYIEGLEAQLEQLQAKINSSPENEKQAEIHKKLASIGFSPDEIKALDNVPDSVLDKVANVSSEPWELGRGVGMAREKTDPLLEFLLS